MTENTVNRNVTDKRQMKEVLWSDESCRCVSTFIDLIRQVFHWLDITRKYCIRQEDSPSETTNGDFQEK